MAVSGDNLYITALDVFFETISKIVKEIISKIVVVMWVLNQLASSVILYNLIRAQPLQKPASVDALG
ncbi:hypothetical protein O8H62_001880 [Enterobacter asburiae]|jgi:hypothetical protein|nr:hypothetical protein [Enterobacter asburiae]